MAKRLYHLFCGVARSLDFVGERWTLLIVRDLLLGPRRYSDLLDGLPGLTTNLLASRLQSLEEDGILKKVKLPPPTPSTVYCLTPLGEELETTVLSLCEWGNRFLNRPTEVETVDLGWTLLRLKLLYAGGFYLTFEVHSQDRVYSVHVGTEKVEIVTPKVADPYLLMKLDIDRAWASVAYSLQRGGFTTIDQNQSGGIFYINYTPEEHDEPGFFRRLLGRGEKIIEINYVVVLTAVDDGVQIRVMDKDRAGLDRAEAIRLLKNVRANLS